MHFSPHFEGIKSLQFDIKVPLKNTKLLVYSRQMLHLNIRSGQQLLATSILFVCVSRV